MTQFYPFRRIKIKQQSTTTTSNLDSNDLEFSNKVNSLKMLLSVLTTSTLAAQLHRTEYNVYI